MNHKLYRILLIFSIVAVLVAMPAFWLSYSAVNDLEVDFLDIGQGDSVLIKSPFGQNILIDGGPDDTVIRRLSEELPWWDRTIDLMILSHPHADHVSGLNEVMTRYKIKRILYSGVVHNSPNYLAWLEIVREQKISLIIIDRPQVIKLGENMNLEIIYPRTSFLDKEVNNLNNSSIAIKLVYRENKFLFAGDLELETERELVESGVDLTADVLKISHHGSDTSSSQEFLQAVGPSIAVIQVGKNNFGHPSRRVIKRVERAGAQVLRNDLDGTIRLLSDGVAVKIK